MALKMATDFAEQPVDLEGALQANTITAVRTKQRSEDVTDPNYVPERFVSSRKRGRGTRQNPSRRGRRTTSYVDTEVLPESPPVQPNPVPVEKPDANMCLKVIKLTIFFN